ncbi:homoserine kinase [Parvibaculum sp.]|uniref:homoserine kinase n=1 Tax=Parvibaculum sp. TaxID=2024848 RepID=UPI000C419182|nr:homoserine kinase [Parvibaculum sp.]MAU62050.1 homoserine kinase [Parvibaculum sp.]MBO6666942.1 homoserine kinase [Parvibaculum sp.]MBO6690386.1 homoserine kinase [Parvibaculum sp.]MBO6713563.1 homoserine kinase [Parvibaculum sp.]|tara:strand:+ start:6721 stop:7686 length:966 start_codon:yes stop_codon:yes gene_type:complete
MAVYTEVTDEELRAFLETYDVGSLMSYRGIAEGVENSNFMLHTDKGAYILTLYEKRVAEDELPFFLGLMNHLASRGIECPTPVRNRAGDLYGRLAGRAAAIISFLEGIWVRRPQPRHCVEVGRALAQMHLAGADFELSRRNALNVDGWRPLFESCREGVDAWQAGLARELDSELTALARDWPRDLPSGVIHADLFPDNVFFIGDRLSGLIDFYFACNDAFAYDLAVCLNAWCFEEDGSFNITKARGLLQAYTQVRPLDAQELASLPLLARGAAMRFLLTRLYDWINHPPGAFVKPKNPKEYLTRLRFHRGVSSPAGYGLDA